MKTLKKNHAISSKKGKVTDQQSWFVWNFTSLKMEISAHQQSPQLWEQWDSC
jgi:hypothetical protein